jgi:phage-related protein
MIVQAGIQLFVAVVQNLPAIISGIVGAIPQIISGIVSGIGGHSGEIAQAGKDLMLGLVSGIKQAATAVWNAAKQVVTDALNGLKGLLGIHSPSRVMRDQIGAQIGAGLALGITDSTSDAVSAMQGMKSNVLDAAQGIAASTQMSLTGMRIDTGAIVQANSWRAPAQTDPLEVTAPGVEGKLDELIDVQKTQRIIDRMG